MRSYALAVPVIATWLVACASAPSEGDAVLVVDYTPEFQTAADDEYERLPASCQPNDPGTPPGCSPLKTLINDYLHLRERLRLR